jgi:hypothetical protein
MGKQRPLCTPLQRCTAHSRPRHPSRATGRACTSHAFYEMGSRTTLEQSRASDLEYDQRARREPPGGRRDVGKRQGEETLRRPCARVRDIPSLRFSNCERNLS